MATNGLAEVFRMDAQLKHHHMLSLDRTNLHFFGMVHESLSDHFQQLLQGPPPRVRLYQQEVERARVRPCESRGSGCHRVQYRQRDENAERQVSFRLMVTPSWRRAGKLMGRQE